jgi:single-strand DNA-binding protein
MRGYNSLTIIGNVGGDPELRYTKSGTPVATFSVAINSSWTDSDGNKQEKVEWVNVVAWKKLAEIVSEYVTKGMPVFIEGRIATSSWEGDDGKKRYKTELIAQQLVMLGGKQNGDRPSDMPENVREKQEDTF